MGLVKQGVQSRPPWPAVPDAGLAPGILSPVVHSCFLCVSPQGTHISHHNEVLRATTKNLTDNRACFCQSTEARKSGCGGQSLFF